MRLPELQRAFFAMLHEQREIPGGELDHVFGGSPAMPAAERARIYMRMAIHRQIDALAADFPKTAALAGEAPFGALAREYLRRHPSEHPSIGRLGRRLPEFLRAREPAGYRLDLPDVAALELARSEVFDEAPAPAADAGALRALAPVVFPLAHIRLVPALRRVRLAFDATQPWRLLDAGQPPGSPVPGVTHVVVWRQELDVFHAVVAPDEAAALERAAQGRPLGEICEAFRDRPSPPQAAFDALTSWFDDLWVATVQA